MSEKEMEDYDKLQEEYDGNDFFDNMQDCNLALNSLFMLLMNKYYKIVRYDHDKKLIEEIQDDLDSLNESPGIPYSYEPLNKLKEKWGKKDKK